MKNLNNFGKKLKLKERANKQPKAKTISEKDLFVETIDMFFSVWKRSTKLYEDYKVNLLEYEEDFYKIIENFVSLKYEPWKAELIMWYVFSREDEEGNVIALNLQFKGREEEEILIKTSLDLWDFIKRLEEEEKRSKEE